MTKTISEINEKIRQGKAVVFNAEEIIHVVEEEGLKKAAQMVDVVTTGTFGPMCSSSAIINTGHSKPKIKMQKAWLNNVEAYCGLAAVDLIIGATQLSEDDIENKIFPGRFSYGGGHVIEDLIAGKDVHLKAIAYGTDCYPRKEIETMVNLNTLNQAYLFNPRNAYQNYAVGVNMHSNRTIYTYMGMLQPNANNANYCTSGQISPLINDPYYKVIGIGTKIFLGGAQGFIAWQGTQHNPMQKRAETGVPISASGTIAVIGDMKQMSPEWIRGTSVTGYGTSLTVGIGVPIPILDEETLKYTAIKDEEIIAQIFDYSEDSPQGKGGSLGEVNYKELKSGKIFFNNKEIVTSCMCSYAKALEIANMLKESIQKGEFELTEAVGKIPSVDSGLIVKPLLERK